jgi:hypothetical protein
VELVRTTARTATSSCDGRHRVEGWCQHAAVVPVGLADRQAERRALAIDDQVPLCACLAAVRRVGPGLRAPLRRAQRRCLPPLGFGRSCGSKGEIAAQRSSETRGAAIAPQRTKPGFVPSSMTTAAFMASGSCWSSVQAAKRRTSVIR